MDQNLCRHNGASISQTQCHFCRPNHSDKALKGNQRRKNHPWSVILSWGPIES